MGGTITKKEHPYRNQRKRRILLLEHPSGETVSIGSEKIPKEYFETQEAECQASLTETNSERARLQFGRETSCPLDLSKGLNQLCIHKSKSDTKMQLGTRANGYSTPLEKSRSVHKIDFKSNYKHYNYIHEPPEKDKGNSLNERLSFENVYDFNKKVNNYNPATLDDIKKRNAKIYKTRVNSYLEDKHLTNGMSRHPNSYQSYTSSSFVCPCSENDGFTFMNRGTPTSHLQSINYNIYHPVSSQRTCTCREIDKSDSKKWNPEEHLRLSYQNSKEYNDLIEELGWSISQRNRKKVEKALKEFEIRSRENKNLDKPILYNDTDNDRTSVESFCTTCHFKNQYFRNYPTKMAKKSILPLHRSKNNNNNNNNKSPTFDQSSETFSKTNYLPTNFNFGGSVCRKSHQERCKSHWELDPQTGTWYKVCNYITLNTNRQFYPTVEDVDGKCGLKLNFGSNSSQIQGASSPSFQLIPSSYRSTFVCNKCGCHLNKT